MQSKSKFAVLLLLSFTITCAFSLDIATTSATTPTTYTYANYGEPCLKITDCDSSAYLTCINGSCLCALSNMKFDDASSSCWVLPGEKCIYKASEMGIGLGVTVISDSAERSIRDRVSFRCVSNAVCEDGFCTCDSGYFATVNGTCERQHEYGEDCSLETACRSSLHLICNSDGKCDCNQTNSIYDHTHGLCVGLAGSSCFDFELCAKNAYCPSFGIFNQYDVKCTCKSGYFEGKNRTCEPKQEFGASCKTTAECREDLALICDVGQGKCTCNSTTHLYDPTEGKCLSLVGSSCHETQHCVPNSDCQHAGFLNGNVLARNMLCRCAYGFFETANRTCEKKREFDGACTSDSNCRDDLKLMCNQSKGRCTCDESTHSYDRSRKRCIGLAGTYCERNEHCVINSLCRSPGYLYPRHTPKTECICKENFAKSSDGFCLGKYGSRCETWTNSCQEDLACRNGECTCKYGKDLMNYDYVSEKCVTHINAPCANESTTVCINNAHCTKQDGNSSTFCMCNKGFVPVPVDGNKRCVALAGEKCSEGENSYMPCVPHAKCEAGYCRCSLDYYVVNGTCERKQAYGEPCSSSENCMDAYCDKTGHCSCNSTTSLYDQTRKTCMRLASSPCYDLRDCVPNALCRSPGRLNLVDIDATCICKEGYYESSNRTCEWKRGISETCQEKNQCQDAADLVCGVHGRCECNQTISMFDEVRRTCLRLAGASCSSHQQCISNAKCRNPLYWVHFDTFSPHAKCECDSDLGYTNSSDGRCIIDYYGGSCDVGNFCSSKFICEDGKCVCPYEDHQIYDYNTKNCVSLVKGPCDNTSSLCVRNAHCVKTEEGVPECRCKQGFVSVDRTCELTFGQPCTHKINDPALVRSSFDEDEPHCDRLAPLKCVLGTCQCGGFQFYDYELQKCRGLVGARCDPEDKGFCSEGAVCDAYRGLSKKKFGRCKCMQGYFVENRSCIRVM